MILSSMTTAQLKEALLANQKHGRNDPEAALKTVRAIHFNDSRAAYNSRVDRHWHIGEGHIGADALRRVAQHPKLKHAAFILETPYDDPRADIKNLAMLRSFVSKS